MLWCKERECEMRVNGQTRVRDALLVVVMVDGWVELLRVERDMFDGWVRGMVRGGVSTVRK